MATDTIAMFAPLLCGGLPRGTERALLRTFEGPKFCGHPDLRYAVPPSTSPVSRDFRKWQKRSQARSGGPETVEPEWLPFDGGDPYIIGGRNDPRTLVFKFLEDPFPLLEGPPTIYEEIRLYKQYAPKFLMLCAWCWG